MIFSFFTRWAGRDIYTHIYRYEYIYHPPHIGEGRCNTLHISHSSHSWICISPSSALPSRHWRRSAENPSSTGTCGISDMLPGIFQSRGIEIYLNSVGQFRNQSQNWRCTAAPYFAMGVPWTPRRLRKNSGPTASPPEFFPASPTKEQALWTPPAPPKNPGTQPWIFR